MTIRVTVWNEYRHEIEREDVKSVYPEGIHAVVANGLREHEGLDVRTATLDEPEHGLTQDVVNSTDVFVWWGHMAHQEVSDEIVERVKERVLAGAGLIVLHSGHFSKIFKSLMGTTCNLKWREANENERLWVVNPAHPIVEGIGEYFELPEEEMYGEHFDIPAPDDLFLVSWFKGGEVFRSGATWNRGKGKIVYFRPGHETFPTYFDVNVKRVIANSVKWAAPVDRDDVRFGNFNPIEPIDGYEPRDFGTDY